jgi:hypothetical protein
MALGFKFYYCPGRRDLKFIATLKCIHDRALQNGSGRVKNWRSVQGTAAVIEELKNKAHE